MGSVERLVLFDEKFDLVKKQNMEGIPKEKAVYALFSGIGQSPLWCRYIGETETLLDHILDLYDYPEESGLKNFMNSPVTKMLVYKVMPDSTPKERANMVKIWIERYNPKCDNKGNYPDD